MARQQSLFHGTLLLTAASLGLRGSSMCFQVFLSNRIGAAGIGLIQLIATVSMLAMTLGSAGVRVASMYLTAEEYGARRPGGMRKALICCLIYGAVISTLGSLALYQFADWIALTWIQDVRAASSLRIIALFMPASCLWSVMAGYFTACSKLKQLVWVQFVDQFISIGITVAMLLLWAKNDTERACISIMMGNGVATALTLILLLPLGLAGRKTPIPNGLSMWRRLTRLCVPLAANDALRSGLSTTEHLLIPRGLRRSAGSPAQAMAAYGTIHGMVFPVMMFPCVLIYSLADLLVPELAKCRAAKDQRRIYALSDRCLRMGLIFAATVAGLCWCLAEPLGMLLYKSSDAGLYLRLFSPLIIMLYMDAMVDGMHKGLGQQVWCVRINTITSLMDVILLGLLLPRFGIAGYFFSFTLTHMVNFYLSLARLMTVTGYTPPLGFICKALLCLVGAALVTAMICRMISGYLLACLVGASVFLAMFGILLLVTASFSQRDLSWLRSVLSLGKSV